MIGRRHYGIVSSVRPDSWVFHLAPPISTYVACWPRAGQPPCLHASISGRMDPGLICDLSTSHIHLIPIITLRFPCAMVHGNINRQRQRYPKRPNILSQWQTPTDFASKHTWQQVAVRAFNSHSKLSASDTIQAWSSIYLDGCHRAERCYIVSSATI